MARKELLCLVYRQSDVTNNSFVYAYHSIQHRVQWKPDFQNSKSPSFEWYRFNRQVQEFSESYDYYWTTLRMLVEGCDFHSIISDEILCDCLVFGIKDDDKVKERLLQERTLTLTKTDEICRAVKSMCAQMKIVSDTSDTTLNAVKSQTHRPIEQSGTSNKLSRECWNCGWVHEYHLREVCPAFVPIAESQTILEPNITARPSP